MKKQPIQVVMLPTKDLTNIIKRGDDNSLVYYELPNEANVTHSNQHLYITVSQDINPIKEGDSGYFISLDFDIPIVVKVDNVNEEDLEHIDYKIICTTDLKLNLPQVQQSFIAEYCSNPNQEWEVEYEIDMINELSSGNTPSDTWVKLNQDNTVNITAVKEKMYSLEDLYLSAANVVDQIAANRGNSDWNINTTPKMIVDNWIKNVDN